MKNLLPKNDYFYCLKQLNNCGQTQFFILYNDKEVREGEAIPAAAYIYNPDCTKCYEVVVFNTRSDTRLNLCANINSLGGFMERTKLEEEEEALFDIIIDIMKIEKAFKVHARTDYILYNQWYKCSRCGRIERTLLEYGDENLCDICKRTLPLCEVCGKILRYDEEDICTDCHVKKELEEGTAIYFEEVPLFEDNEKMFQYHGAPYFDRRFFRMDGAASHSRFLEKDGLPYMGVELELESYYGTDNEAIVFSNIILEEYPGLVHFEEDHSLHYGTELIGEPCTLRYYEERGTWKRIFQYMDEMVESDRTGMHVHVERDYFGKTNKEKQPCIAKLVYLMKLWENDLYALSGRPSESGRYFGQLNFDALSIENGFDLGYAYSHYSMFETDRYKNLNFKNPDTIEFRLFAATTDFNVFIERLKVVAYMCYASRHFSFEQLKGFDFFNEIIEAVDMAVNSEGM